MGVAAGGAGVSGYVAATVKRPTAMPSAKVTTPVRTSFCMMRFSCATQKSTVPLMCFDGFKKVFCAVTFGWQLSHAVLAACGAGGGAP